MSRKVMRVSDLDGSVIQNPEDATKLIVEHHPSFPDETIALDVLPAQVEGYLADSDEYVALAYFSPGEDNPRRFLLPLTEFNGLFEQGDAEAVLRDVLTSQQEEQKPRRRRKSKADRQDRREKIDYSSPEHAGMPHRGTISEAEKAYVREHLEEVNNRRHEQGIEIIDPTDPVMRQRYGLTTPAETGDSPDRPPARRISTT